jgi:hypothetical protein
MKSLRPIAALMCSVALGAASLSLAAPSAFAAAFGARADIPFSFQLEGKTFDAGAYRFEATPWQSVIAMVGPSGQTHLMMTSPLGNPNKSVDPKLIFIRSRGGLCLSEIWINSGPGGHKVPTPPAARGAHLEIALSLANH